MRRILVIGNSGGGKSTLSRKLGAKLGLPVVHLDVLFWQPGWIERDAADFRARTAAALTGDAWVCDGNFDSNFDLRMPLADTIVWVDPPPWLCMLRAMLRVVTGRIRGRPDMADGCQESVDFAFYRWILNFNAEVAPQIEAALAQHGAHARLHRLKSDAEVARFLAEA